MGGAVGGFDPFWYERFFGDDYLAVYAPRLTADATAAEAAFAARALGLRPGDRVLDLGCGTGRHAAALAGAGMRVVGLDLSGAYLRAARSGPGGRRCGWVRADVRAVPFAGRFDAAVSMFTAFGYFDEAGDAAALASAAAALRPGGALLIDTLSRDLAAAGAGTGEERALCGGGRVREVRAFDPVGGRGHVRFEITGPGGEVRTASHHIRTYVPTELSRMARGAGLTPERWYGDYGGGELRAGSRRMIMVARRR